MIVHKPVSMRDPHILSETIESCYKYHQVLAVTHENIGV